MVLYSSARQSTRCRTAPWSSVLIAVTGERRAVSSFSVGSSTSRGPERAEKGDGTGSYDDAVEEAERDGAARLRDPPVEVRLLAVAHQRVLVLGDVERLVPPELDQPEEQREMHRVVVVASAGRDPVAGQDLL